MVQLESTLCDQLEAGESPGLAQDLVEDGHFPLLEMPSSSL